MSDLALLLAFGLPMLPAVALLVPRTTRSWGWALLAGVALGEGALIGLMLLIVSALS